MLKLHIIKLYQYYPGKPAFRKLIWWCAPFKVKGQIDRFHFLSFSDKMTLGQYTLEVSLARYEY